MAALAQTITKTSAELTGQHKGGDAQDDTLVEQCRADVGGRTWVLPRVEEHANHGSEELGAG